MISAEAQKCHYIVRRTADSTIMELHQCGEKERGTELAYNYHWIFGEITLNYKHLHCC